MLCGVGGRTVAEAKANLSYREAHDWFTFSAQRGGLRHTDRLLAILATQINRYVGGDAEVSDFLPYLKPRQPDDEPASIGDVMNILSMVAT